MDPVSDDCREKFTELLLNTAIARIAEGNFEYCGVPNYYLKNGVLFRNIAGLDLFYIFAHSVQGKGIAISMYAGDADTTQNPWQIGKFGKTLFQSLKFKFGADPHADCYHINREGLQWAFYIKGSENAQASVDLARVLLADDAVATLVQTEESPQASMHNPSLRTPSDEQLAQNYAGLLRAMARSPIFGRPTDDASIYRIGLDFCELCKKARMFPKSLMQIAYQAASPEQRDAFSKININKGHKLYGGIAGQRATTAFCDA